MNSTPEQLATKAAEEWLKDCSPNGILVKQLTIIILRTVVEPMQRLKLGVEMEAASYKVERDQLQKRIEELEKDLHIVRVEMGMSINERHQLRQLLDNLKEQFEAKQTDNIQLRQQVAKDLESMRINHNFITELTNIFGRGNMTCGEIIDAVKTNLRNLANAESAHIAEAELHNKTLKQLTQAREVVEKMVRAGDEMLSWSSNHGKAAMRDAIMAATKWLKGQDK